MSVSLATQYTENQKGSGKWKKYHYGNAPATHTHTHTQAVQTLVAVVRSE